MIRQQRWTPDTCANPAAGDACVFIEEWDDSVAAEARVHTIKHAEKLCSFHAHLDHPAAYNRVMDENRRKNTTWLAAQTAKPGILLAHYSWSFDQDGVLTVALEGANQSHKDHLRAITDIQFGPGKVKIQ